MNDAEYLFRQDVAEKKNVANSAKKKNLTGHGAVKMPSDFISKKERDAMNGEVKTYNLSRPMAYAEFKKLDRYLQIEYIESLNRRFRPSNQMLADMLGVASSTVFRIKSNLNVPPLREWGKCNLSSIDRSGWNQWLNDNGRNTETKADSEIKLDEVETKVGVKSPKLSISDAEFTVSGTADDIATLLTIMFGKELHTYSIIFRG